MMERKDVFAMLKSAGMPVAYRQWAPAKPPPLPYVVFFQTGRSDAYADNSNYAKVPRWRVELYSEGKNDDGEAAIERALSENQITYSINETGDQDDYFLVAYYFDTI